MSKFNHYAKKVNEIATEAFKEFQKAEQALKDAEQQSRLYPERSTADAQYKVKAARIQADLLEARENYHVAEMALQSRKGDISALREKLATEIDTNYAADPSQLDSNTIELLKSGILKANDYSNLMSKAQSAGNTTMCRLIAKYAGEAADQRESKYGRGDKQAGALRAIGINNKYDGSEVLESFDVLSETYNRTANNTAMIPHWEPLTSDIVSNF